MQAFHNICTVISIWKRLQRQLGGRCYAIWYYTRSGVAVLARKDSLVFDLHSSQTSMSHSNLLLLAILSLFSCKKKTKYLWRLWPFEPPRDHQVSGLTWVFTTPSPPTTNIQLHLIMPYLPNKPCLFLAKICPDPCIKSLKVLYSLFLLYAN